MPHTKKMGKGKKIKRPSLVAKRGLRQASTRGKRLVNMSVKTKKA